MPIKFNPITGNLDLIGDKKILYNGIPVGQPNGYVSATEVASEDGRLYFFVNGTRYYIQGITEIPPISIKRGQPIGLMGVTYANDVN